MTTSAAGGSCGCAEADAALRETVRERYAAAALATTDPAGAAGCCDRRQRDHHRRAGRAVRRRPLRATSATSCPTPRCSPRSAAATRPPSPTCTTGETVLDLGSGGGIDVLLSARRVGPTGTRLRARHDRRDARARPRQPGQGRRRERRTGSRATSKRSRSPPTTVDVVLSNCVINLSDRQAAGAARGRARAQARRALRRLRRDRRPRHGRRHPRRPRRSTSAASPARSRATSTSQQLADAGLTDIEITETHRVHEHAGSAIVRARKPGA